MQRMTRRTWTYTLFTLLVVGALTGLVLASDNGATDDPMTAPPGGDYQKVSDLVPLPEFIPGMGTLYVQPATLPVGPFLGYDRDGKLVQITYMIPWDDLEKMNNLDALATIDGGFVVDHVSVMYNPGHPGVEVPHYHVTLWGISPDEAMNLQ